MAPSTNPDRNDAGKETADSTSYLPDEVDSTRQVSRHSWAVPLGGNPPTLTEEHLADDVGFKLPPKRKRAVVDSAPCKARKVTTTVPTDSIETASHFRHDMSSSSVLLGLQPLVDRGRVPGEFDNRRGKICRNQPPNTSAMSVVWTYTDLTNDGDQNTGSYRYACYKPSAPTNYPDDSFPSDEPSSANAISTLTQDWRSTRFGGTRKPSDTPSACIDPALLSRPPEQRADYWSDHSSDESSGSEIQLPNKGQRLGTVKPKRTEELPSVLDATYEIRKLRGRRAGRGTSHAEAAKEQTSS